MNITAFLFYSVLFLVMLCFRLCYRKQRRDRFQEIGILEYSWNSRFNLFSWSGRTGIILAFLAPLIILYWRMFEPNEHYGHALIVILLIDVYFSFRWKTRIGEKGILIKGNVIEWNAFRSWRACKKKKIWVIEIETAAGKRPIRVALPPKHACDVVRSLNRAVPDKETPS